ncbi:MAG: aminotransferase class III-fold pyridoxal phosphate-dependent enzyme [Steroidobacteraceae bacterium]
MMRLQLSSAKHPSLAGHSRMARRVAAQIPFYEYDEVRYFCVDDAPTAIAAQRRAGFMRLAAIYKQRYAKSAILTKRVTEHISDLKFIGRYRVPYPFSRLTRRHLRGGSFLQSSNGVTVTDLDGNQFFDLTGSYGVNVFGYDFYKQCIERGMEHVRELGPVLGAYHPLVAYNVQRLCALSGLDEVSFHMSGTEAVMQAVRLARYHTRRTHVVRFCGAYHGWWGDVQPGVGNPIAARETYTLKEMDEDTLRVLRTRKDIACVLVNPLQAMHPNKGAPGDSTLLDSSRNASFHRQAYTRWLQQLREVCTQRGIVLILDEVFLGFRLAAGGAQEYFGVCADMVTYGKTLGGGLPIGAVCGRKDLMKRYREAHPADVCFARGTFNSHPYVMASTYEFLRALDSDAIKAIYAEQGTIWDQRAALLNHHLDVAGLPVRVRNLCSVWMVCYTQASRYNWMLQFYLREQGLALSWVGTGRLIFSLNYTDSEFAVVMERFTLAAQAMWQDGWWWTDGHLTNKTIKRCILKEVLVAWWQSKRDRLPIQKSSSAIVSE